MDRVFALRFAAVAAVLCFLAACGNSSSSGDPPGGLASSTSLLFVQNAEAGLLEPDPNHPGDFLLHLQGVRATLYISDRPQRLSGSVTTADFVSQWESFGFPSDPPSAILETAQGGDVIATALVLSEPVYDADTDTITYRARKLSDLPDFYDNSERAGDLSGPFEEATLYIDRAGRPEATKWKPIALTVQGPLSAGFPSTAQTVTVRVKPPNRIGWSMGELNSGFSRITLRVPSGVIPFQIVTLTDETLSFTVDPSLDGDGNSNATVVLELWLGANSSLDDFSLTAQAAPGISVTAKFEFDRKTYVLDATDKQFSWNPY